MKKHLLFVICLMTIFSLKAFAQPSLQWAENYNGPVNGTDRITDADYDPVTGCIYVTGVSDSTVGYNYVTIKYSSAGQVIWRKRYFGPQYQDSPNALKYDPVNNSVYVTGKSRGSTTNFDWLTIRYNAATGDTVWTKRINGAQNGDDEAIDLDVDVSGNIYVVGNVLGDVPNYLSTKLIKYSPTGTIAWTHTIGDDWFYNYDFLASKVAVNGNKVVVIYSYQEYPGYSYSYAIGYYISNGSCINWNCANAYVGRFTTASATYGIDFDGLGNVYVAGAHWSETSEYFLVTKLMSDVLTPVWISTGVIGPNSRASNIVVDQNNYNVYVTGYSQNSSGNNDIFTIKFNNSGDTIWTKKYNGVSSGDDKGIIIAKDNLSNPNIFVTGYSTQASGKKQITTIKYDNAGNQLWSFDYGCSANDNVPVCMFRDPNDIFYIAGYNNCNSSNDDYLTLKYCTSPDQAGPITGNTTVCTGTTHTYSISPVNGAISYIWTLPSGWSGTSSTNSINAHCGASGVSGDITVKGHNECSNGASSSLAITVKVTPVTPIITENNFVLHSNAINGNQWYNEFGMINGATDQDYNVTSNGDYYDIVTIDGCSSAASNVITILDVNVEFLLNNKFCKIYPNPFLDEFIIELEGNNELLNFEIINDVGQIVFKGKILNKSIVQTTTFPPGVYLIKLEQDRSIELIKIIKE